MSDPAGEPGVPAENHPTSIPPASEKSVAAEVQKRAPKLVDLARTPDKVILRLNKYAPLTTKLDSASWIWPTTIC